MGTRDDQQQRAAAADRSLSADHIQFALGDTSLGAFLVARSKQGICALLLGEDGQALVKDLRRRFPQAHIAEGGRKLDQLTAAVRRLIEAPWTRTDVPLDLRGTPFQQRVWNALQRIQPGSTSSYADLARRIGNPKAVRAVAGACAANAIAIAIPCHRVVRNDGALSGYRWGIERKRALLEREARQ